MVNWFISYGNFARTNSFGIVVKLHWEVSATNMTVFDQPIFVFYQSMYLYLYLAFVTLQLGHHA